MIRNLPGHFSHGESMYGRQGAKFRFCRAKQPFDTGSPSPRGQCERAVGVSDYSRSAVAEIARLAAAVKALAGLRVSPQISLDNHYCV